jgi:hypothetical protein
LSGSELVDLGVLGVLGRLGLRLELVGRAGPGEELHVLVLTGHEVDTELFIDSVGSVGANIIREIFSSVVVANESDDALVVGDVHVVSSPEEVKLLDSSIAEIREGHSLNLLELGSVLVGKVDCHIHELEEQGNEVEGVVELPGHHGQFHLPIGSGLEVGLRIVVDEVEPTLLDSRSGNLPSDNGISFKGIAIPEPHILPFEENLTSLSGTGTDLEVLGSRHDAVSIELDTESVSEELSSLGELLNHGVLQNGVEDGGGNISEGVGEGEGGLLSLKSSSGVGKSGEESGYKKISIKELTLRNHRYYNFKLLL